MNWYSVEEREYLFSFRGYLYTFLDVILVGNARQPCIIYLGIFLAPRDRGVWQETIFGQEVPQVRRLQVERQPLSEGPSVSVEQKVIEIVCEHLAVNKEQ